MPKVSIVILNYNTFALTSNCIRSVISATKGIIFEIILVDNASSECNPDQFLTEFPSVKLVKSDTNGGFAYGNNLGIQKATGEYILLLNSDTLLQEDSVSLSVQYMEGQAGAGVLGCRMVYPGGKIQYSARKFRSISWELLDLFRFIPFLMPYATRSKRMLGKYFRHDENMACDWVNGAFFLFPRKMLEQLPGQQLDDHFFMYGEDQLWCEQIKNLGYHILFYSGTTIIHINSGSTSLERQLNLRDTMMKHELIIMKLRKGQSLYYFLFEMIYVLKEGTRNFIKRIYFRLTGRLLLWTG
ncbi:MAG: glycosyltransferase family 2 protein [Chitinophagaceae bacterium]